jgi:ABC-type lipoprotein export system ATPase subunit
MAGAGSVVALLGDAGVGKTRLLDMVSGIDSL